MIEHLMPGRPLFPRSVVDALAVVALASGLRPPDVTRYARQGGSARSARGGAPSTARARAVERIVWIQWTDPAGEAAR